MNDHSAMTLVDEAIAKLMAARADILAREAATLVGLAGSIQASSVGQRNMTWTGIIKKLKQQAAHKLRSRR